VHPVWLNSFGHQKGIKYVLVTFLDGGKILMFAVNLADAQLSKG